MFCGECGTKNQKDSRFCENCGTKLVEETKSKSKSTSHSKKTNNDSLKEKLKKMPKSKKIWYGIVTIMVVGILGFYGVMSNRLSPKNIAKEYFLAVSNGDLNKAYQYLNIEKNEFTNMEMFLTISNRELDDDDKMKFSNYKIGKVEKSKDGFTANVSIHYLLEGEDEPEIVQLTLVKQKSKKFLFFDDWRISNKMAIMDTKKDYKIKVLKGSKVILEGIEVDKKYIDKNSSDEIYDIYKMPTMFTEKYQMKIVLPMGIEIEDTLNVASYSSYTFHLDEDNLPETLKKQILDRAKSGLQVLYDGAREQKSFDEIKDAFNFKDADLHDLKETYESLAKSLSNSGLNAIEFTEVTLSSLDTTKDGYKAYIRAKYQYTVSYTSGEEIKTHDSSSSDSMIIYYSYIDNAFQIVNASSLNTYF